MSRKENSLAISSTQNGRKVERPNEKVKTQGVAAVVARSALQYSKFMFKLAQSKLDRKSKLLRNSPT